MHYFLPLLFLQQTPASFLESSFHRDVSHMYQTQTDWSEIQILSHLVSFPQTANWLASYFSQPPASKTLLIFYVLKFFESP